MLNQQLILCAGIAFAIGIVTVHGKYCGYPYQNLPRWYNPISYDLNFNTNLGQESTNFGGQVDIKLLSVGSRLWKRNIILHAGSNLNIERVQLFPVTGNVNNNFLVDENNPIPIKQVCHDETYEILVVEIDEEASGPKFTYPPGVNLRLNFVGDTPVNGRGLMRVSANTPQRGTKEFLYTRFNRFDAHLLFPCFDQPQFKTTFKLKLGKFAESKAEAFSTSKLEKIEVLRDEQMREFKVFEFVKSGLLSVHQFGFVVGHEFGHKQLGSINLIDAGSNLGPSSSRSFAEISLNNAHQSLQKFFRTNSQVDIVVLPGIGKTFGVQMAGLIVVDSILINPVNLGDPEETTLFVASCVEILARQWIGIVLTLEKDHESWLFEGLVSVIALQLTDRLYPDMALDYNLVFAKRITSPTLRLMALEDNQPELPEVDIVEYMQSSLVIEGPEPTINVGLTPEFMNSENYIKRGDYIMDNVQRAKAVSLIRFFEQACGMGDFRRLMIRFVSRFAGKLITVDEFIAQATYNCHYNTELMIKNLRNNPGFPLMKVSLENAGHVSLTQERFLDDYSENRATNPEWIWALPLTFVYGDSMSKIRWIRVNLYKMNGYLRSFNLPLPRHFNPQTRGNWVKLNNSFKGFYRVLYSDQMLENVLHAAESLRVNDLDCFQLIDDARAIFESGKKGAYYLIKTLRAMSKNTNEIVQEQLVLGYSELTKLFTTSNMSKEATINSKIRQVGLELFADQFMANNYASIDGKSKRAQLTRAAIYEILAQLDNEPLTIEALSIYRSPDLATSSDIFHTSIFIAVARNGSDEDFNEMLQLLDSDDVNRSEELDYKLITGLAHAKTSSRLNISWNLIKKSLDSRVMIVHFIKGLMESQEGLKFIESTVIPELHVVMVHLTSETQFELTKDICIKIVKTNLCQAESDLMHLFDPFTWNELTTTVNKERHRNYFRQHLDLNKLVV